MASSALFENTCPVIAFSGVEDLEPIRFMPTLALQLSLSLLVLNILPSLIRKAGPQLGAAFASFPIVGGTLLIMLSQGKTPEQFATQAHASLSGLGAGALCASLFSALITVEGVGLWSVVIAGASFFPLARMLMDWLPSTTSEATILAAMGTVLLGAWLQRPICARREQRPSRSQITALIRQLVPAVFVIGSSLARPHLSAETCGLLSSFPVMSLLTFTLTFREEGTGTAAQLAGAYPLGNLAAIVFYGSFALIAPAHGVATAALLALLASVPCSVAAWWFTRSSVTLPRRVKALSPALPNSTCLSAL